MPNKMKEMLGVTEQDTVAHRDPEGIPAYQTHELICRVKTELENGFLQLGALLKEVRDECYYIVLDYDTFQEYCDTPEIDLSRSQVYKLIAIYERWILKYGYSAEEISKVSKEKLYIASSQANETNHGEWLEKAKTLSRADLKAETPGNVQKPETIVCPHCGIPFDYYR